MANGTIFGTTNDLYTQVKIEWESRYSSADNKSNFSTSLYALRSKEADSPLTDVEGVLGFGPASGFNLGKNEFTSKTIPNSGEWVHLAGSSSMISHYSSGEGFATVFAEGSTPDGSFTFTIESARVDFDTEDKAPVIDSATIAGDGFITDEITVTFTPKAKTYNRLILHFYDASNLGPAIAPSVSFKIGAPDDISQQQTVKVIIPQNNLENIYEDVTDKNVVRIRCYIYPYEDSDYKVLAPGYYLKEKHISNVKFPSDEMTMPTAELVCEPVSSLEEPLSKLYWPGSSKIKADLINYAGKYEAEVVSRKITIISQEGDAPFTSNIIEGTNPITVRGTLTDTRGISRTYEQVITPVAYGTPQLRPYGDNEKIIVARCDTEGVENENGRSFVIAVRRNYSNISYDGSQINFCRVDYRIKELGGAFGEWKTILEGEDTSDQIRIVPADEKGLLTIEKTYIVQLRAIDSLENSIELSFTLSSDKVYMHRSGRRNSIAFGGYITGDNSFEVYQEGVFHGGIIVEPLDGIGGIVLKSAESDKQFVISVNDEGALSVTPVNEA